MGATPGLRKLWLTTILRFQQPQAHDIEALPQESRVCLAGSGRGDELHHGCQEQLFVFGTGQNLPESQAQGPPHGPHQSAKKGLHWLSPAPALT